MQQILEGLDEKDKHILDSTVSLPIFSVSNATEAILEDIPNVGDTTTITTITSGNPKAQAT